MPKSLVISRISVYIALLFDCLQTLKLLKPFELGFSFRSLVRRLRYYLSYMFLVRQLPTVIVVVIIIVFIIII